MIHYIKFQVTETRIVELKRVPTNEEMKLINHNTDGMQLYAVVRWIRALGKLRIGAVI